MVEKALKGTKRYWTWIGFLLFLILIGFVSYLFQLKEGLGITGMGRDISWGLYIANFTFLVGVAASAVMVVLPYYLHSFVQFGRITILGEFLAVAAVVMTVLFIVIDLGQPSRVFNVLLYPSFSSLLFWDMVVLSGYLLLNLFSGWYTLDAEDKEEPPRRWVKPLILISIPWAISIHTVTAFIFSGLSARPFWLTAILAPRFLASAFASGPSLLILLCYILKKFTKFNVGKEAIQKVALIVTYAMIINFFFLFVELFTVFYSAIPDHKGHFIYLFLGSNGPGMLSVFMWFSIALSICSLVLLIRPETRRNESLLPWICSMVLVSIWIEKGLALLIPGFIPTPLHDIASYVPTLPEVFITLGVYGIGGLIITGLFKIAVEVQKSKEKRI